MRIKWQAAAYFAASSFAVTARQQMTEALRARSARRQQERGVLAHGIAQLRIEDDGEAAVQVEEVDLLPVYISRDTLIYHRS